MDSRFPVFVPFSSYLFTRQSDFDTYVCNLLLKAPSVSGLTIKDENSEMLDGDFEMIFDEGSAESILDVKPTDAAASYDADLPGSRFMQALRDARSSEPEALPDNRMLSEKGGVGHTSTESALLDLFVELEKTIESERLKAALAAAWKEDALTTLKIIWNARSIHLGKGERETFYRCLTWLKQEHPLTVVKNFQWTVRAIIEKEAMQEKGDNEKIETIQAQKHLLNLLVLTILDGFSTSLDVAQATKSRNLKSAPSRLKSKRTAKKVKIQSHAQVGITSPVIKKDDIANAASRRSAAEWKQLAKDQKHELERNRHERFIKAFIEDHFYHVLHMTIVRLYAVQLKKDMKLLQSGTRADLKEISLAAKWVPSLQGFHNKHTFIASTIAELLYPPSQEAKSDVLDPAAREQYLKVARESYRRLTLSPLRKALDIVERDNTTQAYSNIKYNQVASIAMDNYKELFVKNDFERYSAYIDRVAQGKARISGAALTSASLISQARKHGYSYTELDRDLTGLTAKALLDKRVAEIKQKALDGRWQALVQRIRESGTLSSSIAVCDVSGSMTSPTYGDGTCPLDTSIGLSLLMAEITAPPFGAGFITFSNDPKLVDVGGLADKRSLREKVRAIEASNWHMTTNIVAVFENLLLPVAINHKLKREEMVKQVFIFSDMQFDHCVIGHNIDRRSETLLENLRKQYKAAGYELPKLVFWNLAGGRTAPKAAEKDSENVELVSGYSQGMLKMFLENGGF
ncbi:hypothetical protein MMC25_003306 [Agyrium rufum]|nr:hypothetical protein [Agyrium rufum]